jgi:hypothetical protein
VKRVAFALVLFPVIAEAQDHPRFLITTAREAARPRMKRDYVTGDSTCATRPWTKTPAGFLRKSTKGAGSAPA